MTTQPTNLVQDFAAAPLELRHGEWFGRWWRDPTLETRADRHRQLCTFAFDYTNTRGQINQLELLIQESSFFGFWKIYRLVIAPCIQNDETRQVIVLEPYILNFQIAINLLICLARVEFHSQDNLQRYFSEPNVNSHCEIVRPVGEWPPHTDRIVEDTRIYSNTKFRRLSTRFVPESDLQADIVLCHGLGGHLMRTWTCPSDTAGYLGVDKPWPANQLLDGPHSIYQSGLMLPPRHRIRVLTIGHTLSLFNTNNGTATDTIEATTERIWARMRGSGVGKRPMVWLGHFLGCLLLKEVLLFDSKQSEKCRLELKENLKGIIFYGGPHNGSVFAGALTGFGVSFLSDTLRFRLEIGSPATAYLSTVSPLARDHHAELNKFFFDDLRIPFINFRESKGVKLTTSSTLTQIVKNEESDVNDGAIRTVQSGFVPTDVSVEGFRKIRIQLLVEHHHLDICAPQWFNEEPPDIYSDSRDAIAAWLCKHTEPSHGISSETAPVDNNTLIAELFSEVSALLHAVVSLGMHGEITTNEAYIFRCAWSNLPDLSHSVTDDLESDMQAHTKRETESILRRLSYSLSPHRQGWAHLSDMASKAATATGAIAHAVVPFGAFTTSLVLVSSGPFVLPEVSAVALAALITLLLPGVGDNANPNITNLLTDAGRWSTIKRPDVIQLVDAIRPQLTSVFDKLRMDGLEAFPEIKYTVLRRCRDIIFSQLCAEHVPADNEDILGKAIAQLDSEDCQMRKIIAECQMFRAKARRKAGLSV